MVDAKRPSLTGDAEDLFLWAPSWSEPGRQNTSLKPCRLGTWILFRDRLVLDDWRIRDQGLITRWISQARPEFVFHAAAHLLPGSW